MAGGLQAQLSGGRGVQQPGGQNTVIDQIAGHDRRALVIEGDRAQSPDEERIFD